MRFEEAYEGWMSRHLTQEEAAILLGVCDRTFRRYIGRYEADGLDGLIDKRLSQVSRRRAPVDEVMKLVDRYQADHKGWNVKHFHSCYKRCGGHRSYSWVKQQLQSHGVVKKSARRGVHRKRREAAPWPGMMLHQDGSRHEWVPGQHWDLIVTMDDATGEHYSMFFCQEEGTLSSFLGVREVIERQGLFCSLYTDRGSHYWMAPEVGGKVDKVKRTQFGRAMQQLGIEMIPAYSPEARGRSERAFRTHQDRLVKELAAAGITRMDKANAYIRHHYLPAYNEEFKRAAREEGSAFVPCADLGILDDILCLHHARVVGNDNCVRLQRKVLQLPADRHRCHYVKARVKVLSYPDGSMAIHHGPRELARYDAKGHQIQDESDLPCSVRREQSAPRMPFRATPFKASLAAM